MSDLRFSLLRTVFLPKSSPGISSINELRTDLREVELTLVAPQQLLIKGEMDILVDYNALLPAGESINNSGEPWQALISLPFELTEQVQLAEVTDCRLSARAPKWFMLSPKAIEMEVELVLDCPEYAFPRPVAADAPPAELLWESAAPAASAPKAASEAVAKAAPSIVSDAVAAGGWQQVDAAPVASAPPAADVEQLVRRLVADTLSQLTEPAAAVPQLDVEKRGRELPPRAFPEVLVADGVRLRFMMTEAERKKLEGVSVEVIVEEAAMEAALRSEIRAELQQEMQTQLQQAEAAAEQQLAEGLRERAEAKEVLQESLEQRAEAEAALQESLEQKAEAQEILQESLEQRAEAEAALQESLTQKAEALEKAQTPPRAPYQPQFGAGRGGCKISFYRVKAGDSLNSIAAQFAVAPQDIAAANNLQGPPQPGQIISIKIPRA